MKTPNKLSLEAIAKAADDVRTIQKFQNEALNNGFNSNFIQASITPKKAEGSFDWPLIFFSVFIVALLVVISVNLYTDLTEETRSLLLVSSLLAGTLAVMCAHIRFKQIPVTIIVSGGLIVLIAIGFGILTPKEAIDQAKSLVK